MLRRSCCHTSLFPTSSSKDFALLHECRSKPGAYGQLGLADLFELREECLREFGFADVYRQVGPCGKHSLGARTCLICYRGTCLLAVCRKDKERENRAALEVLPDLLGELDQMSAPHRLLALIQARFKWLVQIEFS